MHFDELRVAVVHDWLTGMRGGEKVLEAVLELVPHAEIFTLFHHPGTVSASIERHPVHTSFLQKMALHAGDYRRLLPLFPRAVESWDLSGFDLILSTSHAVAKGAHAPGVPHVCYCHTPMRYIWDRFDDYFPPRRRLLRLAAAALAPYLRAWDVRTASRVDAFIANSQFVRERIRRYYDRDAAVVYPFVDRQFLEAPLAKERGDYHVIISALVPYKRIDLAIEAARVSGRRLRIIGNGPLREKLVASASEVAEFLGWASTDEIIAEVGRARSLILPGVEDFGITCLEAMACGTPVVALGDGGALESVSEGCGVFFDRPEVAKLTAALDRVESETWDRGILRARAAEFSKERFQREYVAVVSDVMGGR